MKRRKSRKNSSRRESKTPSYPKLSGAQKTLISYWRASVVDGQRSEAVGRDLAQVGVKVDSKRLFAGRIPPEIFTDLFRKLDPDRARRDGLSARHGSALPVVFCPLCFRKEDQEFNGPRFIELLWIPALLSSDGTLSPPTEGLPWIPRSYLEPVVGEDAISVGSISDLEEFAETSSKSRCRNWSEYIELAADLLQAVVGATFGKVEIANYSLIGEGLIATDDSSKGSLDGILRTYDEILSGNRHPGVLEKLSSDKALRLQPFLRSHKALLHGALKHTGHLSEDFPLSVAQRHAVHHLSEVREGGHLTVTGPPGTGKTTLLQSVIASWWVNAVSLDSARPPIIVATGATNQAVMNVIDSLGRAIGGEADGDSKNSLLGHWLPGVNSLGTFCASATKAERLEGYQLELRSGDGLSLMMENEEYFSAAERQFARRFEVWSDKSYKSPTQAKRFLFQEIRRERRVLSAELTKVVLGSGLLRLKRFLRLAPVAPLVEIYRRFRELDTTTRHRLFLLSVHFWEARWLEEVAQILKKQRTIGESRRTTKSSAEDWTRRAMITPAFVSTLAMLPRFFSGPRNSAAPMIDLLIVDEAGQAAAELGAGCLALAKRALIVGDDKQLEPVWTVPPQVDRGNVERLKLGNFKDDTDWRNLTKRGVLASNGNLMRLAILREERFEQHQHRSVVGITLVDQRRSVPEIVSTINDLAYQGRLKARRHSLPDSVLPPLGYIHVAGRSRSAGQSRLNRVEAEMIASWVRENHQALCEAYGVRRIGECLAILSPFTAQIRFLKNLLLRDFPDLTIGTVNTMQGAERSVIVFSPVYDPEFKRTFLFDRSPNMLNVAISRARDSFIVVGHMVIFDPSRLTPSAIVANHIFAEERYELLAPIPRNEEMAMEERYETISSLDAHRQTLSKAIELAKSRVIICSAGISIAAIRKDRLGDLIQDAVARGVEVIIYTDTTLDLDKGTQEIREVARLGREALVAAGADLRIVNRIHNKSLAVDKTLIVEGSFNWLSAIRNTDHEFQKLERSFLVQGPRAKLPIEELMLQLAYHHQL